MAGFGADLLGGLISGKPTIPTLTTYDLGDEQSKAIAANAKNLPAAENLAANVNNFNENQIQSMLEKAIPGYSNIKGKVSGNIQDLLAGKIPKDVSDLLQTSDASKAIGGGYSGSGSHANLVARDLGLTSLQLTGQGLSAAESWLGTIGQLNQPGTFNLSSMFITPQQYFAADTQNAESQFQRNYVSNMNDWQHSFNYFLGKDVSDTMNTIQSAAMSMLGGGMGGMMGGGGGGGAPNQTGPGAVERY